MEIQENINPIFTASSYEMKEVDEKKLWEKIYESLKLVLNKEFSSGHKREARPHKDRISFACVYCGDSHKDPRKKRGNIFARTMQYHCFNGDCNAHLSVYNFLDDKRLLNNFNLEEQLYLKRAGEQRTIDLKKLKASLGLETFFSDEITDLSVERSLFMEKMKLVEIRGSRIEKYLVGRHQTDFRKFAFDLKGNLLYVFNLDASFERIIGCQIKTFNKRNPYLTWKISRIHQELGIFEEENAEPLEKMDFLSNIFGIFQVDLNKPITIFEGPLDSFLFPNAVGICSAKNSMPFEIEGSRYFYDNDGTGREWSIRRITEGKPVFLWRKFLEDSKLSEMKDKIKDLNDLLIYVRNNSAKTQRLADYFSDSHYDAIWI